MFSLKARTQGESQNHRIIIHHPLNAATSDTLLQSVRGWLQMLGLSSQVLTLQSHISAKTPTILSHTFSFRSQPCSDFNSGTGLLLGCHNLYLHICTSQFHIWLIYMKQKHILHPNFQAKQRFSLRRGEMHTSSLGYIKIYQHLWQYDP